MLLHVLFTSRKRYGGTVYQEYLSSALGAKHHVVSENIGVTAGSSSRIVAGLKYVLAMFRSSRRPGFHISVKPMQAAFFPHRRSTKTMVVVHHIDTSYSSRVARLYQNAMYWALRWNKRRIDKVIVVSQFWKRYLERRGFPAVAVVYNFLNRSDFVLPEERVRQFRRTFFPENKRIYYLGNPLEKKGYHVAYEALKDQDAYFVVTGNGTVSDERLTHLNLSYADYHSLLCVSDVVITMSLFREGWCRVAHEAMMCGTPVIGSGYGGMAELLVGGGQTILEPERIHELPTVIDSVLANREAIGQRGRAFASQFDHDRFVSEIHAAIEST